MSSQNELQTVGPEAMTPEQEETFAELVAQTHPSNPIDVLDSTAECNPQAFLEELQLLCQKHNMTIFAGAMGLRFIPRDSQGINIAGTDDIASVYFTQSFADKAFYPVQY